ncbi:hypothetical protein ACIB24_03885 [Spongisporangium articulatum]|uniref:Uncharacterized protein n=1 Tax=Spongisporangium articulatum TaxID=3362603 RepID=A0ABW8AIL4_9ACTN
MRKQGAAGLGPRRVDATGRPSWRARLNDRVEAFAFDHLPVPVLVRITRARCARRRAAARRG